MAKLPCIPGVELTEGLVVSPPTDLRNAIEQQCRAEWLTLHRIEHASDSASPLVPLPVWQASIEGKAHTKLMNMFFSDWQPFHGCPLNYQWPDVPEMNRMWSQLQSQRYEVRGKRARYANQVKSGVAYRKFRSWWVSKHIAAALGEAFDVPCPFEKYVTPKPPESYIIIGEHFEEWTGRSLPPQAWEMLRGWETDRLNRSAVDNQGDTNA